MRLNIEEIVVKERKRNLGNVQELAESIKKLGLLNPITITNEHVLIAGFHRLEACRLLGHREISVNVTELSDLEAELAEIDENLIRNELTVLEQGEHLLRRNELLEVLGQRAKQGDNRFTNNRHADSAPLKTTKNIANEMGISKRVAQENIQIAKKLDNEVKEQIKGTELEDSKTELLELSRLTPEKQKTIVDKINSGQAKNVKEAKNEERRQERIEKIIEISQGNKELKTEQKHAVIYADPPWKYEFCSDVADEIENHYPTMDLRDICSMPISDITTDDCILFLWATSPKLEEAFEVINFWGFTYRSSMVWDKEHISMGYYARQQHEFLLIATKGNIPCPKPSDRPPSVYKEKRTKHSKKPVYFYEMIEKMYPKLPKIELFARETRKNWNVWGNQV